MDHRHLHHVLASALLILSCGACDKREALREQAAGGFPEDHVIRVSTEVAPATKGSYTTDNLTEFDLMVTDHTNSKYSFWNTRFSKSASGEWVPDGTRLWGGAKDAVTIYAVAPCFKERNTWNTLHFDKHLILCEVEAEQSEESKDSDYLCWVGAYKGDKTVEECLTDGKLKIEFMHMLSLVRLTFKFGTEFNNGGVPQSNIISDVVISGTVRTFYMSPGIYADKLSAFPYMRATASDVKPYYTEWHAADKTGNCTSVYECILVPQTVMDGGLKISFKADGKAYEWVAPRLTFSPNAAHSLTLKVGKDVVVAGGFSASEWEDGGSTALETE